MQAVRRDIATAGSRALNLQASRSFSNAVVSSNASNAVAMSDPATDINIKYNGRQSVSGVTATVFGGYGFVGRYVINRLGRIGSQVVVPYRGDGQSTRHLKVMGDLGQMVFRPIAMTDEDSIRKTVERSDVIINLLGSNHETKNYSYDDVNVKCVHRIAKIAAESGNVKRFVHVSAAGASHDSKSEFLRSKARGEDVVRDYFPQATIIRPCNIFGDEDKFLNRYADMVNFFPLVPLIGDGEQKIQPIYVQDVAQCIVNAMVNSDAPGKTFTLGGPEVMTKEELVAWVAENCYREPGAGVPVPDAACRLLAKALTYLPTSWRLLSPDDVNQRYCDLTVPARALGCADLGLAPTTLQREGTTTLIRHRGDRDYHGDFSLDGAQPRRYGKVEAF